MPAHQGLEGGFVWTGCCPDLDTIVAVFSGDVRTVVSSGPLRGRKSYWTMIGVADARTGEIRRSFRVESDYLARCCLSPDGRMLAAVGRLWNRADNTASVLVWDLRRGVELFHADLPRSHMCAGLAFSADGRTVLLTSTASFVEQWEHAFRVFEIASGKPRASLMQTLDPAPPVPRSAMASDHLAALTKGDTVSLFDPLTGTEYGRLRTNQGKIGCVALSRDGKRLACAGDDTTALIWDIGGLTPAPANARLADDDLARLWAELLSDDAETAFRAIRQLVRAPDETVRYLGKQLQPLPPVPEGHIKTLVARLDSPRFAEREQAMRELRQLPDLAGPALTEAAKNPPSVEAERRIGALLAEFQSMKVKGPWTLSGEPLRHCRATEVLERIGSPGAERLLRRLAGGAPHGVLTRQAQEAARRLAERTGTP